MVKAYILVEKTSIFKEDNNFYFGNNVKKDTIKNEFFSQYDRREQTAPYGVKCVLSFDNCGVTDTFVIDVSRYFFDVFDDNEVTAIFNVGDNVFCLHVVFDREKILDTEEAISDIFLEKWFSNADFEQGDDCDQLFTKDRFSMYETVVE